MFSISSFDTISVVVPNPKIFLFISASTADSAAVTPNGTKILLGIFSLMVIQVLVMDQ